MHGQKNIKLRIDKLIFLEERKCDSRFQAIEKSGYIISQILFTLIYWNECDEVKWQHFKIFTFYMEYSILILSSTNFRYQENYFDTKETCQ